MICDLSDKIILENIENVKILIFYLIFIPDLFFLENHDIMSKLDLKEER